jgi:N-methylhydantoinase B
VAILNSSSNAVREGAFANEVTLKIGWDRLRAIVNEQAQTILRTAFSPLVREQEDLAAAVFDPRGRMLASADTGTPGHINPLRATLAHIVEKFPPESLRPGDALCINDPWLTTGQLLDITVVTPVFADRRLVAFFASTCHHADVGGIGMGAEGNDMFEEGLMLPATRFFEAGERVESIWDMIMANVRRPDLVGGDLEAQLAANLVGARGLIRLLDELEEDNLQWLADQIIERSESAMRESITALPDGVYRSSINLDGYERPVVVHVAMHVIGDRVIVDYDGTSDQSAKGINVVLNYTAGYTAYAIRIALNPEVPNNSGSLAPIEIKAAEGSIVNCRFPAATSGRHLVGQMLPGAIMLALAQAEAPHCVADGAGGVWAIVAQRPAARGGGSYTVIMAGGMGARRNRAGLTARLFPANGRMALIEEAEDEGSFRYVQRGIRRGSGGEGVRRGGNGQTVEFEFTEDTIVTVVADRTLEGPPGALGGGSGAPGVVYLNGEVCDGKWRRLLPEGTLLRFDLPGGGGWGQPNTDASETRQER